YCIKTKFHTSRNLSHEHPGAHSFLPQPILGPRSTKISVHGPHGPVSPIAQKLSASPRREIRSLGKIAAHKLYDSSSLVKTVAYILLGSKPISRVKKSQAN